MLGQGAWGRFLSHVPEEQLAWDLPCPVVGRALVREAGPWRGRGGGPRAQRQGRSKNSGAFNSRYSVVLFCFVFNIFQFSHYFHFSFNFPGTVNIFIAAVLMSSFASLSSLLFLR